jgi:hypothetical protein
MYREANMTDSFDPLICNKIINYLVLKDDKKDCLEGILLGLFPNEIDKLAQEILLNLNYLISIGKIQPYSDGTDKGFFKVLEIPGDNPNKVS